MIGMRKLTCAMCDAKYRLNHSDATQFFVFCCFDCEQAFHNMLDEGRVESLVVLIKTREAPKRKR